MRELKTSGVAVAVAVAGVACSDSLPRPRPELIDPDSAVEGESVAVTIRGSFPLTPTVSFNDESDSSVDRVVTAYLGGAELEDSTWVTASEVTATVPPTLATGVYDLTVVVSGRSGSLANAFTVTPGVHWRTVSLDAGRLGASCSGALVDFPALIALEDPALRSVANGGHVQHELGYDVTFFEGGTRLSHEVEQYDPVTGALVAWVRIPRLAGGTILELVYGNAAALAPSEDPTAVWSADFRGVWHLHDDFADSTSYGHDGTSAGTSNAAGWVADGEAFDGSDGYVHLGSPAGLANVFWNGGTISAWFYADTWGEDDAGRIAGKVGRSGGWLLAVRGTGDELVFLKTFAASDGSWSVPIELNAWNHVTVSYDSSSTLDDPTFYLNGQVAAATEGSAPAGAATSDTGADMHIGNRTVDTGGCFDGVIDEVRLARGQRSACWVETELNNQLEPTAFFAIGPERSGSCVQLFAYRKSITVPAVSADLTDFPLLVSLQNDADLRDTSSGGNVVSSSGWDIVFRDGGGRALAHEIEAYDETTGTLVAWVRVPRLSASAPTTLFIYYGNTCIRRASESPANVWDAEFGGVWHLHDDSDDSAGGNHGTAVGTSNASGQVGGGRSFDGAGDYIYTSNAFVDPRAITVEAWFRTSTASGRKIVGFENARSGEESMTWDRMIWIGTDGRVYFGCYYLPLTQTDIAVSAAAYTDGAWHHVAGVRDDVTDVLRLFVDGNEVDTQVSLAAEPRTGYWRIGAYRTLGWTNGVDGYFAGSVDEVRISTTARTAEWISTSYANQADPASFYTVGAQEAL